MSEAALTRTLSQRERDGWTRIFLSASFRNGPRTTEPVAKEFSAGCPSFGHISWALKKGDKKVLETDFFPELPPLILERCFTLGQFHRGLRQTSPLPLDARDGGIELPKFVERECDCDRAQVPDLTHLLN